MSKILIYQTQDDKNNLEVTLEDETLRLNKKQLYELFGKLKSTISGYIKAIFEDKELNLDSTVRNYRIVQKDGNREVGGVQFRKWAKRVYCKGFCFR